MLICPSCELEMRCLKTGAVVETMTDRGPYKLFSGDAYYCRGCSNTIVYIAPSTSPIAEHFEASYPSLVQRFPPVTRAWATQQEKDKFDAAATNASIW